VLASGFLKHDLLQVCFPLLLAAYRFFSCAPLSLFFLSPQRV
jgi:hypothetical protein